MTTQTTTTEEQNKQWALIAINQLTRADGTGLGRLRAMVGGHNVVFGDQMVQFNFKGCRKANKMVIKNGEHFLDDDTYTVEFWRIPKRQPWNMTKKYEVSGLYADQLHDVFVEYTGLRLVL